MSTAAEQYRALVAKLESIQQLNELKIGDIDPRTGRRITGGLTDSEGNLVGSGTPGVNWNQTDEPVAEPTPAPTPAPAEPEVTPVADPVVEPGPTPAPVAPCGPEAQAQIKAQTTFNAAYALAKKSGCPEFDWCQIVKVPGQGPTPVKQEPNFVTTNPMGDFDPTQFSGDFTKVREEAELEESTRVDGNSELDRIREIAGTQVVEAAGVPEIKASTKQQAIEIARKKGITVFRFCSKYKVKNAKKGQGPMPAKPEPQKVDYLNQADPLGGTMQNPMSFAPNSGFGA